MASSLVSEVNFEAVWSAEGREPKIGGLDHFIEREAEREYERDYIWAGHQESGRQIDIRHASYLVSTACSTSRTPAELLVWLWEDVQKSHTRWKSER